MQSERLIFRKFSLDDIEVMMKLVNSLLGINTKIFWKLKK